MGTTNNLKEVHSASGVGYINQYDVEKYGSVPNVERSKREYLPVSNPNMEVFHSLNFENGIYVDPGEGDVVGGPRMMKERMVFGSGAGVDLPAGQPSVTNSLNGNPTGSRIDSRMDSRMDNRNDSHSVDPPHTVDALFNGNKYKVKKIKETHSISADYNQKKNLTSILPFEKIIEQYEIKNLYPQSKVQELYNHQNVYEEKGRYNLMSPNGYVASGTMRKELSVDSSDGSSPYLSKGSTLMYGGQYTYGTSVDSSSFGGANRGEERHISAVSSGQAGQMGHAANGMDPTANRIDPTANRIDLTANRVNLGSPPQVEPSEQVQINAGRTGHPGEKAIPMEVQNMKTKEKEKEKAWVPPHNDWEQNEECTQNNLLEMYDHKQNRKVIYYAVKNHYDPTKEMHKKEKEKGKGNYPPDRNKVYQNDIYDYLLHHYEKNYNHIFDSRYMDKSIFKGELKDFLASQGNPHRSSVDGNKGRDTNGTYIAGGILNTKNYDNDDDVDNSKRKNRNAIPHSSEEGKQSNLAEVVMSDKLKGTHLRRKNRSSLDVNDANDTNDDNDENDKDNVNTVEDVTPLNGREDNTYQTSVEISNLCDEDAMDLYKNIGEVYTPRSKLFVYAVKDGAEGERRIMEGSPINEVLPGMDTPLGDLPLQINKEMKKIFKRMKHKNTVVISNVGVKTGSSTFSNHILNSGHERGFFGGASDQRNCVYAHVMASPNKINYVYLDYDKLVLGGGRSNPKPCDDRLKRDDRHKRDDRLKNDDRLKRDDRSRSARRSSCGDGDPHSEVKTLVALSFYLSNIIIFHINSESCSKAFCLLAQYYDVVRHIREHVKRRRGKDLGGASRSGSRSGSKSGGKRGSNRDSSGNSEHGKSLGKNGGSPRDNPQPNSGEHFGAGNFEEDNSDEENIEEDNFEEDNFEEDNFEEDNFEGDNFEGDNFSVPHFVFVLRDTTLGKESGADMREEEGPNKLPPRKSLTREAETKKVSPKVQRSSPTKLSPTGDDQSARAQKLMEELIEGVQNPVVQKKVKYVLKFLAKKSLFHLPPPKEKNKEEYTTQLRKIKKEIFINGKNVEYMYPNNGIYVYKYLNMLTYTINRRIFYTPNYLKKKMESYECKTLHKVLTDNFLFHVRRKIENKLPMKPNLFLTLINDIKIEFLLSFETLCIGNSSLKRKYKNKLCHNIDVIVLKAYKENIAFSCFTFFNIIDKKINKLQIYSKISRRKYEHFEQLRNDINNINDGSIDNLIYNEILGIKKEEIFTYFIKTYYSGFASKKGSSFVRIKEESEGESQYEYDTHAGGVYTKAKKKNSYNSDSTVDPGQFTDPFGHQRSRRSVSGVPIMRMHTSASSTLMRRGSLHHNEKESFNGQQSINYGAAKQLKGNKYKSVEQSIRGKDSSHESLDGSRSHRQKGGLKDATDGRRGKQYTDEEAKGKKPSRKSLHKFKSDVALQNERKIKMIQELQLEDGNISKKYRSVDYKNALPGRVHQNGKGEPNSDEPSYHGGEALQPEASPQPEAFPQPETSPQREASPQHAGVQTWPIITEPIKKQEKQRQKKR